MVRYDRDEVLAQVDLAALADSLLGARHPRTRSWSCPNPDHAQTGRTPPVSIFTDRRGGQRWHCHGCGDGGTAIDLTIQSGPARDFREALEWLAHHAHVSPPPEERPPRQRVRQPVPPPAGPDAETRRALRAYVRGCANHLRSSEGREVRRWLTETRAIPQLVLDTVGVGADPGFWRLPRPDGIPKVSPAAVFPIWDDGDVVFTISRVIRPRRDLPRWVNTRTSVAPNPRLAVFADPTASVSPRPVIVTEGVLDALSVLSAGHTPAALLGTGAIDSTVADRLAKLRKPLLLATDNDQAGQRARERHSTLLTERGVDATVLEIPERFNDLNDWHVASGSSWREVVTAATRLSCCNRGTSLASPGVS